VSVCVSVCELPVRSVKHGINILSCFPRLGLKLKSTNMEGVSDNLKYDGSDRLHFFIESSFHR